MLCLIKRAIILPPPPPPSPLKDLLLTPTLANISLYNTSFFFSGFSKHQSNFIIYKIANNIFWTRALSSRASVKYIIISMSNWWIRASCLFDHLINDHVILYTFVRHMLLYNVNARVYIEIGLEYAQSQIVFINIILFEMKTIARAKQQKKRNQ